MINTITDSSIDLQNPAEGTLQSYLETLGAAPLFVLFVASEDPVTNQPWCPDVRAAVPVVHNAFEADGKVHNLLTVKVGSKLEWREPKNAFRVHWGLQAIPTMSKYSLMEVEGNKFVAVRMLVEAECLDVSKLMGLINEELSSEAS
ncbi:hypothetical protein ABW20_dc0108209 [Dactylellina cionopaga]|nr:hypothetical protein ABW20_dc0108209 [Dactylellina cionopaga]